MCHGITGNAYFLMQLYRITNDDLWKQRAQTLIMILDDDMIETVVRNYNYGLTKIKGVPDTPYSLMEG